MHLFVDGVVLQYCQHFRQMRFATVATLIAVQFSSSENS